MTPAAFHALHPFGAVTPRHTVLTTRSWSLPVQGYGLLEVETVLLSGAIGDYTVYVGAGEPAWVADHGNKVPFELASLIFPGIEERRYRP